MKNKESDKFIEARGIRVHNLKNISVAIPQGKLVVVTGLSGSGKSSLAFDTLYAEGQRRYVESLSAYARQFLGRMVKPDVDFVKGIPPAIAIEQKVNTNNSRSTVGTSTEIYDYLKLLFARVGDLVSPTTGEVVHPDTLESIADTLQGHAEGTRFVILAPVELLKGQTIDQYLNTLAQQGFSRIELDGVIHKITDLLATKVAKPKTCFVVIDRMSVKPDSDTRSRLMESLEAAYYEGKGKCVVRMMASDETVAKNYEFSKDIKVDGAVFEKITANTFAFNNPLGACTSCGGLGKVLGIDRSLVIPDPSRSVAEDAIVCWKGETTSLWKKALLDKANLFDFPSHRAIADLTPKQRELLWTGNKYFRGIDDFFAKLESQIYKVQNRVMLARYRGRTVCADCRGTRLKKEASYIKVGGKSIQDLVLMPIGELSDFFQHLQLDENKTRIAKRLLLEIDTRLQFLCRVGLDYLTLNRLSATLSGGESQRINLSTSLGSSLVGSLYILDEPSIGLHARDTDKLITVLRDLQAQGNTVLVVEHDEAIIREADYILDIGPLAGRLGGEVLFAGPSDQLLKSTDSLTADYLTGRKCIPVPSYRRVWNHFIQVNGASENNLKDIAVKFPLNVQTVVTGVSGSGKNHPSEAHSIPSLEAFFWARVWIVLEKHGSLTGDLNRIESLEFVDQNPIGKSSRSNPATYLKAYEDIRKLFSEQKQAKMYGFSAGFFSFNTVGGRCDECQGDGTITVEMQFMADLKLTCDSCKGKRFTSEVLEVRYQGKNIDDVLNMTVNESIEFFEKADQTTENRILKRLLPLQSVGLGYVKLGQASSTLSGGESQRVKLAFFLSKESIHNTLFIFDEPTTGLHFHDINTLQKAFNALIEKGHTVLIIEHNLDIVKSSDWVIDLGPEGGERGGTILFEGTPEDLLKNKNSYTAEALRASWLSD